MKFENKKVMAVILAVAAATALTGCSESEDVSSNASSENLSDNKDLPTSTTIISSSSEVESTDSSLNSYDTSKPIEIENENPTGEDDSSANSDPETSSDLTDDKDSSANSDKDNDNPTGDLADNTTGETSTPNNSTGDTSTPNTSNTTDDLTDSTSDSTITNEEFKAIFGYDIPEGAYGITKDGYYDKSGYIMSKEAHAAMIEISNKRDAEIDNGTFNGTAGMTDEDYALLDKIFFG